MKRARRSAAVLAAGAALGLAVGMLSPAAAQDAEPRIVNGTPIDQATYDAKWSFTVRIRITTPQGVLGCGGSMITDQVVLTAAHCLEEEDGTQAAPADVQVTGGSFNQTTPEWTQVASDVDVHPNYDGSLDPPDGNRNDIAMILLPAAVDVAPVVLALPGDIPQGGPAEVGGWGCTSIVPAGQPNEGACQDAPGAQNIMREAAIPAQPAQFCNDNLGTGAADPTTQVCAGTTTPGGTAPDTCQGDSGGPIVVRDAAGTRLVGATSFGVLCGYFPGIYSAVGGQRAYIDGVANGWDPGGLAPQPAPEEGTFVPLTPARVADTRSSTPLPARGLREFQVAGFGGVPASGVTTVALNATATNPVEAGFLTLYPCGGTAPLASNVNYVLGENASNAQAVGLSADGKLCVATYAQTDVVIDVYGYWQAEGQPNPGTRFNAIPPERLFDTRQVSDTTQLIAGQVRALGVGHLGEEQVKAAALNLTVVDPTAGGFLSAFPCGGSVPATSIVNFARGETVANSVNVGTGADETVCFMSSADTNLIVDATGWFGRPGSGSGGRVVPTKNGRLADTRETGNRVAAGTTLQVPTAGRFGVPADAVGVVLNVTAVDTAAAGYLTAFPCGQPLPPTSTVNYLPNQIVPNLTFTGLDPNGSICVFSYAEADVVVDVQGYVVA